MPILYASPTSDAPDNATVYLRPTGKGFAMNAHKAVGLEMRDGASNTVILVEASDTRAVPWTKPDDLAIDPKEPLAGLIGQSPDSFLVLFADGSARQLPRGIDSKVWHALLTHAGGESVDRHSLRVHLPKRPRAKATEKAPE